MALLINLKKAIHFVCNDLLIVQLNPYGFDRDAKKLVFDWLSDISYNKSFFIQCLLDTNFCSPQRLTLGLFENRYMWFGFWELKFWICNFTDDTTPYECGLILNEAINQLEKSTEKIFEWYQ